MARLFENVLTNIFHVFVEFVTAHKVILPGNVWHFEQRMDWIDLKKMKGYDMRDPNPTDNPKLLPYNLQSIIVFSFSVSGVIITCVSSGS